MPPGLARIDIVGFDLVRLKYRRRVISRHPWPDRPVAMRLSTDGHCLVLPKLASSACGFIARSIRVTGSAQGSVRSVVSTGRSHCKQVVAQEPQFLDAFLLTAMVQGGQLTIQQASPGDGAARRRQAFGSSGFQSGP